MGEGVLKDGIAAGRLSPEQYAVNFGDLHPPLERHEAFVEADRCYFCYDAPCQTACPTSIDIPMFIREIVTDNPLGAAKTIFEQNILGGMCARVCPTEQLCEEACVREAAEGKPVKIGLLQRYATDIAMDADAQFFTRAEPTGKRVAVVGAGPAGLAAAHRLALHGHEVVVYRRPAQGRRPQRIWNRVLQDAGRLRPGRGRLRHRDRRHHHRQPARSSARISSLADLGEGIRCGVSRHRPRRRQCAARRRRGCAGRRRRHQLHRRAAPDLGPVGAADRPPRRRHRRRHDRGRCRGAVQAARRRGGDHGLPPRQGAHERLRLRAGSRRRQGRHHPPLAGAQARADRGRQGHGDRARLHGAGRRHAEADRRDHDHRLRPDLQGHRPDARHRWRRRRPRRRQDRGRRRRQNVDPEGLGRRRLRHRRRRPDGHRRRRRPRRGRKHQPVR